MANNLDVKIRVSTDANQTVADFGTLKRAIVENRAALEAANRATAEHARQARSDQQAAEALRVQLALGSAELQRTAAATGKSSVEYIALSKQLKTLQVESRGMDRAAVASAAAFGKSKAEAAGLKSALRDQEIQAEKTRRALSAMGVSTRNLSSSMATLRKDAAAATTAVAKPAQAATGPAGAAVAGAGLAGGMAGLGTAVSAAGAALLAKQYAETAVSADRLWALMEGAAGSVEGGARAMEYARGVAQRYGLDLTSTATAYGRLMAAARGTVLEGRDTERVFAAVAKASATLSLSAADTEGVLLAVGQMISKGTVSAEELRGQMGERLPGAFQIAARAMGVTTAELDDLLKKGDLATADFLPRFAAEMDKAFGSGRFDNAAQNIARLNTAWTELKQNLTDSAWVSEVALGLTERLQLLSELADRLGMNRDSSGAKYGPEVWAYMRELEQRTANSLAGRGTMQDPGGIAPKPAETKPPATEKSSKGSSRAARGDQYDALFQGATARYGLPAGLLKAIADQESGFNPAAKSPAGALGMMQFMPGTAARFGLRDRTDPAASIDAAGRYFRALLAQFRGNLPQAVAAYNMGEGSARRGNGVSGLVQRRGANWLSGAPAETRAYVPAVLGKIEQYSDTVGLSRQFDAAQTEAERRQRLEAETQQYLSQQRQAELDRYARAQEAETARIEEAYQARQMSAAEYFGRLDALQQAAAQRQVAALEQEVAAEKRQQADRETGTIEYVQGQEKLLALETRIAAVRDGANLASLRNRGALTAASREQTQAIQDQIAALRLRLMQPGAGATVTDALLPPAAREEFQARLTVLESQYRDFIARLRQVGNRDGEALVRRAMAGEAVSGMRESAESRIGQVQGMADTKAQGIRAQQEAGNLTQIQAREQIATVYRESADAIEANVQQLERLAEASQDPAIVQAAERARTAWLGMVNATRGPIETLMLSWSDVGMQLEQQSTYWLEGLSDQLAQLVTTGKASFGDFARAILADLVKIGIQAMMARAAMALLGGGDQAGGGGAAGNAMLGVKLAGSLLGAFAGLGGAASAGANAAAAAGAANGAGAVNVSGGLNVALASIHHRGGLAGLATELRPLPALAFAGAPRYHGGGLAGLKPQEVPAILQGGPKGRREEVLTAADPRHRDNLAKASQPVGGDTTIVNVLDPALVGQYLATKPGERLVMNIINRNSSAIRRMSDRG